MKTVLLTSKQIVNCFILDFMYNSLILSDVRVAVYSAVFKDMELESKKWGLLIIKRTVEKMVHTWIELTGK